jgi:cytochrome c
MFVMRCTALLRRRAQFLDYIKGPKAKIPGTIMVFVGIKNEDEARSLWAHLKQFDSEGTKK